MTENDLEFKLNISLNKKKGCVYYEPMIIIRIRPAENNNDRPIDKEGIHYIVLHSWPKIENREKAKYLLIGWFYVHTSEYKVRTIKNVLFSDKEDKPATFFINSINSLLTK